MKVRELVILLVTIFCNSNGDYKRKVDLSKQATSTIVVNQSISNNTKSGFERKIDSLRQIIPIVTGNQTFSFNKLSDSHSFQKLSQGVWDWQNSSDFVKIDSTTWINHFIGSTQCEDVEIVALPFYYRDSYKVNYYYKEFDFKDSLINLIILQYVNNDRSCMYLVQFDKQGNRKKILMLAYIEKGPEWVEEIYSSIQENKITTYRYYEDNDSVKRDSVMTLW